MENSPISRAIVTHDALMHCYNDRGCVSCPMYDECEGDVNVVILHAAESLAEMIFQLQCKADAEPVRHGRWIPEIVDCIETVFKCSECCRLVKMTNDCGYKASKYASHTYPYCHCGAKMDAEVE